MDGKVVIWAPEKGSSSGVWRGQSDRRRACLPESGKFGIRRETEDYNESSLNKQRGRANGLSLTSSLSIFIEFSFDSTFSCQSEVHEEHNTCPQLSHVTPSDTLFVVQNEILNI
jgi:hypothetical protein